MPFALRLPLLRPLRAGAFTLACLTGLGACASTEDATSSEAADTQVTEEQVSKELDEADAMARFVEGLRPVLDEATLTSAFVAVESTYERLLNRMNWLVNASENLRVEASAAMLKRFADASRNPRAILAVRKTLDVLKPKLDPAVYESLLGQIRLKAGWLEFPDVGRMFQEFTDGHSDKRWAELKSTARFETNWENVETLRSSLGIKDQPSYRSQWTVLGAFSLVLARSVTTALSQEQASNIARTLTALVEPAAFASFVYALAYLDEASGFESPSLAKKAFRLLPWAGAAIQISLLAFRYYAEGAFEIDTSTKLQLGTVVCGIAAGFGAPLAGELATGLFILDQVMLTATAYLDHKQRVAIRAKFLEERGVPATLAATFADANDLRAAQLKQAFQWTKPAQGQAAAKAFPSLFSEGDGARAVKFSDVFFPNNGQAFYALLTRPGDEDAGQQLWNAIGAVPIDEAGGGKTTAQWCGLLKRRFVGPSNLSPFRAPAIAKLCPAR